MGAGSLLHAIDFGTSNSAIVVVRPDGRLISVADPASPAKPSVPTSVCVLRSGKVEVGQAAENAKKLRPSAYRSGFKRDFGRTAATPLASRPMTADEMTVEVLRFLREQAQKAVPGNPDRVLITIPVVWEAGERRLMRSAARRAGYADADIELIPEPVAAAAYAFGPSHAPPEQLITLVYDLGGGTFDCAVTRGVDGWYEVLGVPGGLDDVGGVVFDRGVLGLVRKHFGDTPADLFPDAVGEADVLRRWLTLEDQCERLKWTLSADAYAEDLLAVLTPPRPFGLARAEFEELIGPLVARTVEECERLLGLLEMGWARLDRLVLAGGSSRIPLVEKTLSGRSGCAVLRVDQPEMAAVLGAALIGRGEILDNAPRRVFVNGRQKVIRTPEARFEEIVALAFADPPAGPYVNFTVTYSRPGDAASGSLVSGRSVRIQNGMVFNVTATDKS